MSNSFRKHQRRQFAHVAKRVPIEQRVQGAQIQAVLEELERASIQRRRAAYWIREAKHDSSGFTYNIAKHKRNARQRIQDARDLNQGRFPHHWHR